VKEVRQRGVVTQSNGCLAQCNSWVPWDLAEKPQISLFAYPSFSACLLERLCPWTSNRILWTCWRHFTAALVFLLKERSTVESTGSLLSFSAIEQQDVKKVSPKSFEINKRPQNKHWWEV